MLPSLSKAETTGDSKISDALAIADNGHSSGNSYTKLTDGNTETVWEADSNVHKFITFDMQAEVKITGIALRGIFGDSRTPADCKLEYGPTESGPWSTALTIQAEASPWSLFAPWQYFSVPISTATRYGRLYVTSNHGHGSRILLSEVEFFQKNSGTRADPAPYDRVDPPPGTVKGYCKLYRDGNGATCMYGSAYQWPGLCSGTTCSCDQGYTKLDVSERSPYYYSLCVKD